MHGLWQAMKLGAIFRHSWLVYVMYDYNPAAREIAMARHLRFVDDVYEGLWAWWGLSLWSGRT